jgi:hypothetical protein
VRDRELAVKTSEDGSFDPQTIGLMRNVLDDAWRRLSPEQRARLTKSDLATRILKLAAKGERDPVQLRTRAVVEILPLARPSSTPPTRQDFLTFSPQLIDAMREAFHAACKTLRLREKDDALTEIVAEKVVELAKAGERDPKRLCTLVLGQLSGSSHLPGSG